MIVRPCEHCGVQFDAESQNVIAKRRGKLKRFCSRRCRNLSRPARPEKPPEYFQRPCGVCGTIFDATPSRPKYEKPRKYCRGCVLAGRKATIRRHHAHCKQESVCKACGKRFMLQKRLIKSGKHSGQYCSMSCVYADRKGKSKPFTIPLEQGTRTVNAQGYIMVKVGTRWVREHRHVMEQRMGRPLHPWENVHHKDGNRQHNTDDNLELWIKTQPTGMRFKDLTEIYGAELLAARRRILELEEIISHRPL